MKCKAGIMGVILGLVMYAFMAAQAFSAEAVVEEEKVTLEERYVKTADNFIVLFDTSASMGETYKDTGLKKVEVAKNILKERNELLPELDWNVGLFTYTPFKSYLDMQPYFKTQANAAIDRLPTVETAEPGTSYSREMETQRPTPLGEGIRELDKILSKLSGRTVVFLFSDGTYTLRKYFEVEPVPEAQKLASKYDVCFYIFSSAATPEGEKTLDDIAAVNQCSRVVPFDAVYQRPEYITDALYVVKSHEVVTTETVMEPEVVGQVVGFEVDDILFDTDEADIRNEFRSELDAVGRFMNDNPDTYAVLSGYTDSTYTREYNLELSRKRAESVRDYLTENANIGEDRFVMNWYGEDNPVADNSTAEGRAKNRRVEVVLKKP
ncbi:MAG: OmpA family protein [Desulfatiglandaceae bacterium]